MMLIANVFRRTISLVRAPIWWTPKILPVIGASALAAIAAEVSATDGLPRIAAMVISAIGVAAFAHVVNDLSDREADRKAGKHNSLSDTPLALSVLLLISCVLVSTAPWLLVSIGRPAAIVLATLVATSIAYSTPPLRLKSRGVAGVIADAAVAHVFPIMFAFVLMGSAGSRTRSWWVSIIAASVWSLGFGIRNIIVHQILDAAGDTRAEVDTFVVRRGIHRSARTARDSFILELVGLIGLAFVVIWVAPYAAIFFAAHGALWQLHRRWDPMPIDTVPTRHGQWLPLAEFYEVWPAIAFCSSLALKDLRWGWLLGVILIVFWSSIEKQLLDQLAMFAEFLSWAVAFVRPLKPSVTSGYHKVRVALLDFGYWLREIGYKIQRALWALYRAYWRVRHRFDPLVCFIRRQFRRAKRILSGNRPGKLPVDHEH